VSGRGHCTRYIRSHVWRRLFLLRKEVSQGEEKAQQGKSERLCTPRQPDCGRLSTTIPSLSWAQEIFREGRTNRSFLFELGIQYGFPKYTYNGSTPASSVGLRLRCPWNLFLK